MQLSHPSSQAALLRSFLQRQVLHAGERMFELFTPAKLGKHRLFFTCGWTFVIFSVFWYMIGDFPYYQDAQFPDPTRSACLQAASKTPMAYGSSQLVHWINQVGLPCSSRCRGYIVAESHLSCQQQPYGSL